MYYGEWAGQEVAVKVMSAEASHQTVVLQEVSFRRRIHCNLSFIPNKKHHELARLVVLPQEFGKQTGRIDGPG